MRTILTICLGFIFGTILIASEAFHWFRIQEMFHFDSFHMYGLLGSAISTAAISIWLIRKLGVKTLTGKEIKPIRKSRKPVGNVAGGILFGFGWALTGACTAPVFILVGVKWEIGLIALTGVLVGSVLYAVVKSKLPE